MGGFIEPNIHPVLVHFAYALSLSALGVYLFGRVFIRGPRRAGAQSAADWMLALGAVAIVATIAAGFYAYYTVAHDGPSHAAMTTHRNWAVPSGTAILILAIWRFIKRANAPSGLFLGLLAAAALSLSVTAWWGGHIVYNYGLGVKSLPVVTGDGHDHEHGAMPEHSGGDSMASVMPIISDTERGDHDDSDGHHNADTAAVTHDNSDGHHDSGEADMSVPVGQSGSPAAIADQFGSALRAQDSATLKSLFMADAIIAEGGGAERSFGEYSNHHMKSDMAYTAAITTKTIKRDVVESPDMATVITQSEMTGRYKGESVSNRMMETMTLRRESGRWKIAHIHWSSAPMKEADASMPKTAPEGHDNTDGHHDHDDD